MAKCNNCGVEIIEGAKFCSECGAPIVQVDENAQWEFDRTVEQSGWEAGAYTWADNAQGQHQANQGGWEQPQSQGGWSQPQYNQQYGQNQYNQQYGQYGQQPYGQPGWNQQPYNQGGWNQPYGQVGQKNKIAAGILAIVVGALGIHKFYLGYTSTGVVMLLVSILTLGFGAAVMGVIGIVEGIIYLTKTDYDFYETYEVNQKKWF